MKLRIDAEVDRLAVVSILAKNGYTVKITRDKPEGKSSARNVYYVEYWDKPKAEIVEA